MTIFDIFQNQDGSLSSRRIFGIVLIGFGLLGWFLKLSETVSTIVIGIGAGLIGATTADPRPPA